MTPPGFIFMTKGGETLSQLATEHYWDYRWWPHIYDVNRRQRGITHDVLPSEVVLSIPAIPDLTVQAHVFARAELHRDWYLDGKVIPLPEQVLGG